MNNVITKWIAVAAILLLTGCASIVSKSDWPVQRGSNPSGATVTIVNSKGMGIYSGLTPTTVTLTSKKGYFTGEKYKLIFEKEGFSTLEYELKSTLNGWYIGNVVFGGLVGLIIVDPLTGAMYRLDTTLHVPLTPDLSLKSEKSELKIVSIDQLPANLKSSLVPIN